MSMDNSESSEETEFPIICTYCRTWLNGPETGVCGQEQYESSCLSHGSCPDCLLENFPQEYISIQKERGGMIENTHKNCSTALIGKLEK
jgi:hypothetical protein